MDQQNTMIQNHWKKSKRKNDDPNYSDDDGNQNVVILMNNWIWTIAVWSFDGLCNRDYWLLLEFIFFHLQSLDSIESEEKKWRQYCGVTYNNIFEYERKLKLERKNVHRHYNVTIKLFSMFFFYLDNDHFGWSFFFSFIFAR